MKLNCIFTQKRCALYSVNFTEISDENVRNDGAEKNTQQKLFTLFSSFCPISLVNSTRSVKTNQNRLQLLLHL